MTFTDITAIEHAPRLLTIDQAAERLGVPRTWLRDKVSARAVPHTRLGKHVRFTAAHLASIVAAGEQEVTVAEAASPVPAAPSATSVRPSRIVSAMAPSGRRRRKAA